MRRAEIIWDLVIKIVLLAFMVIHYYREDLLGVVFFGLMLIVQVLTEIRDRETP